MDTHDTEIRVRYGETDQAGVVYYANYLLYFEVARTAFMRAFGIPYTEVEDRGFFLTVADASCKYLGTAKYDDQLVIRTSVTRVTHTRAVFHYEVLQSGTGDVIATGDTTLACIDRSRKLCRLPEDVRHLLQSQMGDR